MELIMRVFEDDFSDAQAEMVYAALEYANDSVDNVYIFVYIGGKIMFTEVFFSIEGQVVEQHKVPNVDTSKERQIALMKYIGKQAERIVQAGKEYNRIFPTEYRIHYRVKSNSLDAKFQTGEIYDHISTFPYQGCEQWKKEVSDDLASEASR
jgi:hypothetical protein